MKGFPFEVGDIVSIPKFVRLTAGSCSKLDNRNLTYNPRPQRVYMGLDSGLRAGFKLIKPVKVDRKHVLFDLDSVDEARATAEFEILDVRMDGGGYAQGNDYYPDAITVKVKRLDKPEWITFTYDCNFRTDSVSKGDVILVRKYEANS